jgi:hypothetical protein
VPDVAGPDLGYVDTVYTLECYPYDRDWDDVAIRYDWGDGDTSGWSDWAECGFAWGAEPELIEMTHSWVAPGTFLIRAQATDDRGLVSDWSEPRQMAIQAGSGVLADTPWPKFRHDNKNTGRVGGGR